MWKLILLSLAVSQCVHLGRAQGGDDLIGTKLKQELKKKNSIELLFRFLGFGSTPSSPFEHSYNKIDAHLVKNVVSNDNTEDNINEATNWLNQFEPRSKRNENLIDALKHFTSLAKIQVDENKCNRESYAILSENILATKNQFDKTGLPSNRIAKIVLRCFNEHAKYCHKHRPEKFKQINKKIDKEVLRRVGEFAELMYMAHSVPQGSVYEEKRIGGAVRSPFTGEKYKISKDTPDGGYKVYSQFNRKTQLPDEFIMDILLKTGKTVKYTFNKFISVGGTRCGKYALSALKKLVASDDKDHNLFEPEQINMNHNVAGPQKSVVIPSKERLNEMFNNYLVTPCETYIRELSTEIYEPAKFDDYALQAADYDLGDRDRNPEAPGLIELYTGLHRIKACQLLVKQDHQSLLEHMLEHARKVRRLAESDTREGMLQANLKADWH